jgi:trehalose/maltose transport system substrate-binding protein
MHSWFYAHRFSNQSSLKGVFDVTLVPRTSEGKRTAVLGGWQLLVSRYSQQIEAAVELVKFLASPSEQRFRAIERDDNPSVKTLYEDPELVAAYPYYNHLRGVLSEAIARPTTATRKKYSGVSTLYQEAIHTILTREYTASEALQRLEQDLIKLLKG